MEWLEGQSAKNLLWPKIKYGIQYFIENSELEEHWPSEYCLRFLSVFMAGSAQRQLLVGSIDGVVEAVLSVLLSHSCIILGHLQEHTFYCVSSLLGKNMLISTVCGSSFIRLGGFRVLVDSVTEVIARVVENDYSFVRNGNSMSRRKQRMARSDFGLMLVAMDALRCYFTWITHWYDFSTTAFSREEYCYSEGELVGVAAILCSIFDTCRGHDKLHNTLQSDTLEGVGTLAVCFGDMIRNNFEPAGILLERVMLYTPDLPHAHRGDDVESAGAEDCSDTVNSDGDGRVDEDLCGSHSGRERSSNEREIAVEFTAQPHDISVAAQMTLLDRIVGVLCSTDASARKGGGTSGHQFLVESVVEWGEESHTLHHIIQTTMLIQS